MRCSAAESAKSRPERESVRRRRSQNIRSRAFANQKSDAKHRRACCIGRLAVDNFCQRQGLGTELLVNALLRIVRASLEIGIYAVRVDAIDERAKQFYLNHEFIPFIDNKSSLFHPLQTIKQEFNK